MNDRIPYNVQMLATITSHQVGTVEKAISVFKELGLIETLESGVMFMTNIQDFIGRGSTEAERKKRYRERIRQEQSIALLESCSNGEGTMSYECPVKRPPEIEIETEIEKEIKYNTHSPVGEQPPQMNSIDQQEADFKIIYAIYPKKAGRTRAFEHYRQWIKGKKVNGKKRKFSNREIYLAVQNYVSQQEQRETPLEFYKNFDTLMGKQLLDYVEENKNEPGS